MKLSTRVQYGLRMLCQLALSYAAGPLQLGEIGEREGISEKYLGQIMLSLRSGKLVDALRGSQGGYFLARPPSSISVLEVLVCLDGAVLETEKAKEGGASSPHGTGPAAAEAWARLRSAMEGSLRDLNLEDLAKISVSRNDNGDYAI